MKAVFYVLYTPAMTPQVVITLRVKVDKLAELKA
jgi:hypothetical protein